jgi:N-methylhydantoinase B
MPSARANSAPCDIHTIGAGGGSIACLDNAGAFRVGPHSAGADPGPAAYGRGGVEPTVTDANLVLGRLDPENFLGGAMRLDPDAAQRAVLGLAERLGLGVEDAAEGILTIVNANMANAISSRTVQKGLDPRGFALVAAAAGPMVYDRGVRNDAVWQLLRDNIRVSDLVVGDMEAQIAAARIGAQRLGGLIENYGYERFTAACAVIMDHAERLMRQAIAALPDGDYSACTMIDGFVDSPDPQKCHLPIAATVRVRGDEIEVDLTGTADQVADRPINMPFEGTVDVAVWLTVRSVLLGTAVCGHIPVNHGLLRPIRITAPLGSLANPVFPAPTIARFCPGNQLADTVMQALAQALPGQVSAGIGNLKVIAFSGTRQGKHWVHMEIFEGSYGGRDGLDGMDAVDTLYANTRNNPIEDIESHLPLRVSRYELREGASGAGEWRGGLGSVREFVYLADGGASVEGEGHIFAPWGLGNGKPGSPAELLLVRRDGTVEMLPSKVPHT